MSFDKLSTDQLKAALQQCVKLTKERMAPLLYYLRLKLRKQGSRRGEGFGAWVAVNLPITRRTADTWANEWAVANKLMKATSRNISRSWAPASRNDDLYSIEFAFEPEERREFQQAAKVLGPIETQRVIYEAVIEAAKTKKPKARRAATGR